MLTTNYSNNYSLYHFSEELIPLMILNALAGKPLPTYGNGMQMRDWLYERDHYSAIHCVLADGQPRRDLQRQQLERNAEHRSGLYAVRDS